MADPKPDTKSNDKATDVAPVEAAAPTAPAIVEFTSANGGVYHHPTTMNAGARLKFAPGFNTKHELDWFCQSLIDHGCIKIVTAE